MTGTVDLLAPLVSGMTLLAFCLINLVAFVGEISAGPDHPRSAEVARDRPRLPEIGRDRPRPHRPTACARPRRRPPLLASLPPPLQMDLALRLHTRLHGARPAECCGRGACCCCCCDAHRALPRGRRWPSRSPRRRTRAQLRSSRSACSSRGRCCVAAVAASLLSPRPLTHGLFPRVAATCTARPPPLRPAAVTAAIDRAQRLAHLDAHNALRRLPLVVVSAVRAELDTWHVESMLARAAPPCI